MQQMLNHVINLLKWPVGILSLLLLIPVAHRLWRVLDYMFDHSQSYMVLFYGFTAYLVLWFVWFQHSVMGEWFSTLEHELTHAIFAVLSLNKVTGLNATGDAGGVTHYQGYGNWIISLSPYFVPTLSLLVLLMLIIAKSSHQSVLLFMMGVSMSYHIISTWQETHPQQTDLSQSGWVFVWMFLPTANLVMFLILLTALPHDGLSTERSLNYVWDDLGVGWEYLSKLAFLGK